MQRSEFSLWVPIDVRWGDMDAMGHVNNATYFTYLESARVHLFATLGSAGFWEQHGAGPVLAGVSCNFRVPVVYPARLEIGTNVTRVGNSSFHLAHAFFHEGEETLVADAASITVWIDYARNKSTPLPDSVRQGLEQHLATA